MSIFQNRDQEAPANAPNSAPPEPWPRWRRSRRLSVHQNSSFLWQKALPTLAMRLVERHHEQMLHMLRSVQIDFVGFISIVFQCFAISWYELHFFELRAGLSDWAIVCDFFSSSFSAVLSSLNHKQHKPVAGPEMPLAPKSSVSQIPSKSPGNQRSRTLRELTTGWATFSVVGYMILSLP